MTNSLQSPLRMRRKKHTYQDDSAFQKMYTKNTACILMESPQRKSRRNFVKYSEFQSFPKYGLQQSSAIADTTASITFSTHRVQCRKRKVDETSTELPILEPPNTFPTPVTDVNGVIVHQSIKRNRSNRPSHYIIDTIPVSILDNSTSLLFPMPGWAFPEFWRTAKNSNLALLITWKESSNPKRIKHLLILMTLKGMIWVHESDDTHRTCCMIMKYWQRRRMHLHSHSYYMNIADSDTN